LSLVFICWSCVGRGLCNGLISRPEESYPVSNCVWLRNNTEEGEAQPLSVVPWGNCPGCFWIFAGRRTPL
jgi:hypothetical protein